MDEIYADAVRGMNWIGATKETTRAYVPSLKHQFKLMRKSIPMFGTGEEIYDFLYKFFSLYPAMHLDLNLDEGCVQQYKAITDEEKYNKDYEEYEEYMKEDEANAER